MGMNRHETGTLLLKKPGRMRWTYAKPAGKLFVLDGNFRLLLRARRFADSADPGQTA